ncbi:MAG TPA: hypothetical protein VFO76_10545 [Candidatus Kapabacteria bacterium]|nr:hypothetical protein [Candidatus Kapabacteria bacterium]
MDSSLDKRASRLAAQQKLIDESIIGINISQTKLQLFKERVEEIDKRLNSLDLKIKKFAKLTNDHSS